jgi:hypothetical protein
MEIILALTHENLAVYNDYILIGWVQEANRETVEGGSE